MLAIIENLTSDGFKADDVITSVAYHAAAAITQAAGAVDSVINKIILGSALPNMHVIPAAVILGGALAGSTLR